MFEKVDAEALNRLQFLAACARDELAAAGLPIVPTGMDTCLVGGVEVVIDQGKDTGGGVFAGWVVGPRLSSCVRHAVCANEMSAPVLEYARTIKDTMSRAMAAILTAAGFTVEDANDEYRTQQLRVVSGHDKGVAPLWALRDDELELWGWKRDNPNPCGHDH